MFYPEISPAVKWHQLHNQRLYSNFVFPNCAKHFQEEEPDFGEFWFVGWRDFEDFVQSDSCIWAKLLLLPCSGGFLIVVINISQSQVWIIFICRIIINRQQWHFYFYPPTILSKKESFKAAPDELSSPLFMFFWAEKLTRVINGMLRFLGWSWVNKNLFSGLNSHYEGYTVWNKVSYPQYRDVSLNSFSGLRKVSMLKMKQSRLTPPSSFF